MGIPTYNVWNGDPGNLIAPRRPGLDDLGGAGRLDDLEKPPDPVTMPNAGCDNLQQRLSVSHGKVAGACKGSIHFSGSTPSIASFSPAGDNVITATFTVTDNGIGDTSITWPANTFPPNVVDHTATLTGSTVGMIACQTLVNGLRVRTKDGTNTVADLPFNFEIN